MKIVADTSVIVDVEHGVPATVQILTRLLEKDAELLVSTITVAEILTGPYLMVSRPALLKAKRVLNQFSWIEVDGQVAEKTAQLLAYLHTRHREVEFQDVVIAATLVAEGADYLLTLNKKDFLVFAPIAPKVYTPTELRKVLKM